MKIFDLHSDTFSLLFDKNLSLDSSELAVNIAAFKSVEKAVQQFAVFLRDYEISSADRYKLVLENGKQALLNSGIRICTRADVLENDEKIIALLSIENAGFIKDVSFVDEFYKDGIVTVSLTWNGDNKLAGGALGDASLTSLGVDVIKRMNRLSMAVDLSHLNRKSFYEALKEARFPCATHSGIDFILHHPRNLDDAQLKSIKEKGGIVGICFYPDFIGNDAVEGFLKALEHCLELYMEDNVSIGSDFDGADMSAGLKTVSDTVCLYKKTVMRFGKTVADKVFYQNASDFYYNVLTNRTL